MSLPSLVDLANEVAVSPTPQRRCLLLSGFMEHYRHVPPDERGILTDDEPPLTGDPAWDALIAGLAEHLAELDARTAPAWTDYPARFLTEPWCFFDVGVWRTEAEEHSPPSFRRHGVLIRPVELEQV